jgi:hypothetical protein
VGREGAALSVHDINHLTIAGKRWAVVWCATREEVGRDALSYSGICIAARHEIRCWRSGDAVEDLDTLLHELLHAVAWEQKSVMNDDKNHNDLARMSSALADTLTRNGLVTP